MRVDKKNGEQANLPLSYTQLGLSTLANERNGDLQGD